MMTGVPMVHGAERVLDIVEQSGGLVVAAENCTGLDPLLEDVDEAAADPLRALAEKYFHLPCSVMTPNDRRLDVLRQLAADYRAECVIELEGPRGKMRIEWKGTAAPDLAGLSRALWESA